MAKVIMLTEAQVNALTVRKDILQAIAGELTVDGKVYKCELTQGVTRLDAIENPAKGNGMYCKVSPKGALSVYGLQQFPVTLYAEQWERILFAGQSEESIATLKATHTIAMFLSNPGLVRLTPEQKAERKAERAAERKAEAEKAKATVPASGVAS